MQLQKESLQNAKDVGLYFVKNIAQFLTSILKSIITAAYRAAKPVANEYVFNSGGKKLSVFAFS